MSGVPRWRVELAGDEVPPVATWIDPIDDAELADPDRTTLFAPASAARRIGTALAATR